MKKSIISVSCLVGCLILFGSVFIKADGRKGYPGSVYNCTGCCGSICYDCFVDGEACSRTEVQYEDCLCKWYYYTCPPCSCVVVPDKFVRTEYEGICRINAALSGPGKYVFYCSFPYPDVVIRTPGESCSLE